jgi:hypothetical protein
VEKGVGGLRGQPSLSWLACEYGNEPRQWKNNRHGAFQPQSVPSGTGHGAVPRWHICEHEETGNPQSASERQLGDTWLNGFESTDGNDGYVRRERQSRDFDGFVGHHHDG